MVLTSFLAISLFIGSSMAVDIGDFSNDLATDLGPLLALFGDSMTKQFLSESTSFLDYLIFAVAPIGILTTLVSTTRLCGSTAFRAFIGRSQEGQGAVEAELCTSTSRDVCELFTRGGIQRVLGRPSILELVYLPRAVTSGSSSTIAKPEASQLLRSRDYFSRRGRSPENPDFPWREQGRSHGKAASIASSNILAPNPNLLLNIGIRRPPDWALWSIACVGIFLQAGVLALAGAGVWILGWELNEGGGSAARDYAPIMFIVGSILMCSGMWACAFLIGQTTQEVCFERHGDESLDVRPRLLWLQPGPQVIGDQSFDPFAYIEGNNTLKVWSSSTKSRNKNFELYTYLAVLATLVGYIMQFIGIRGMEAWIALAQLAVTVIMSILRGSLRTQRLEDKDNLLRNMPDMVAGYELDWLAVQLSKTDEAPTGLSWYVTAQHEKAIIAVPDVTTHQKPSSTTEPKRSHQSGIDTKSISPATTKPNLSVDGVSSRLKDTDDEILEIRMKLANITGLPSFGEVHFNQDQIWADKHVKVRTKARNLASALGFAATAWFSRGSVRQDQEIMLRLRKSMFRGGKLKQGPISITLRPPPEFSQVGWRLDAAPLEAILGLWMWTMVNDTEVIGTDAWGSGVNSDEAPVSSVIDNVPTARIVSIGLDDSDWAKSTDVQGEMNLWLGRSSIKLRQSTLTVRTQQHYGLATLFLQSRHSNEWEPREQRKEHFDGLPSRSQRFSGWNPAHRVISSQRVANTASPGTVTKAQPTEDATVSFRIQHTQLDATDTSPLDVCCQELFVTLIMSLIELEDVPIGNASFVEHDDLLRLEHPVVTTFAEAFVEGGLGTYSDALLCILPALRDKMPSLDPETMLPELIKAAETYRRAGQWERARKVLQFGITQTEQQGVDAFYLEQALLALCELYRWSLSTSSGPEQDFGLNGIDSVVDTYANKAGNTLTLQQMLDAYQEIAERYKNGSPQKEPRSANNLSNIQARLVRAIESRDLTEALYQLCLITPACERSFSVPASALALSARNNWIEVVATLLELRANPNDADEEGKRGIYHCAELGNDACAKLLLGHQVSLDSTFSKKHRRLVLLHIAAQNGQTSMVKLLLNNGFIDVDGTDLEQYTALSRAAQNGRTDIVEILLNTPGVTVERPDLVRTPLSSAAENGNVDIIRLLVATAAVNLNRQGEKQRTALFQAVANGKDAAARVLIQMGANIEIPDLAQNTPLAFAVQQHNVAMVKLLTEYNANVNAVVAWKRPILYYACIGLCHRARLLKKARDECEEEINALISIVTLLLGKGANADVPDDRFVPLLSRATYTCNRGTICLDILLTHGANIESRDKDKCTPLMHAAHAQASDALLKLLEAGADIEAQDAKGRTPLFHAMKVPPPRYWNAADSLSHIRLLLEWGASVDAKNKSGDTVLQEAMRCENVPAVKMWLDRGADGELRDDNGVTATQWLGDHGDESSLVSIDYSNESEVKIM